MTHDDLNPHAILHTLGLTEATAITPVHGGSDAAKKCTPTMSSWLW